MRKLLFIFLVGLVNICQAKDLSPQSIVSIITCDPGQELYSIYGHSAIRIQDPLNDLDLVYNYGTFDFDTPNFYWKFASGKLHYYLSASRFERFITTYQREERSVREQILFVDLAERQKLLDALEENRKEENKFYKYDFFYDNCSSRILEILQANLGKENLVFECKSCNNQTFRELIDLYALDKPWIDCGLDVLLGIPTDAKIDSSHITFLPDYLSEVMEEISYKGKDFVSDPQVVYQANEVEIEETVITPFITFWVLFLALGGLLFYLYSQKGKLYHLDTALFIIYGLFGFFPTFLQTMTDHQATYLNLNLLWFNPLMLAIPFVSMKTKVGRLFLLINLTLIAFGILEFIFPGFQGFNFDLFPLSLLIGVVSFFNFDLKLKSQQK